jgi:hypothetical protein
MGCYILDLVTGIKIIESIDSRLSACFLKMTINFPYIGHLCVFVSIFSLKIFIETFTQSIEEGRNAFKILTCKPTAKKSLVRPRGTLD